VEPAINKISWNSLTKSSTFSTSSNKFSASQGSGVAVGMGVGGIADGIGVGFAGMYFSASEHDEMIIAAIEISIIVFFIVAPSSFLIC
jgi:hypothetical protein